MPSNSTSSELSTRPTSNATVISKLNIDTPVGNRWYTCTSDGQLEPGTYSKGSALVEVGDLCHMLLPLVYPEVHVCPILCFVFSSELEWDWFMPFHVLYRSLLKKPHTGKLHCLLKDIYGTMRCAYHGNCQNISEIVVDNDSDDWVCSWISKNSWIEFSNDIAGKVVFKFTLLFPFTIFLSL